MPERRPLQAVTFDAYNTLFDFSTNALATLRTIVPPHMHPRLDDVWRAMNDVVAGIFKDFIGLRRQDFTQFITLADIHRACFEKVQETILPTLDIAAAADAWNRYIATVPLYDDAQPAVDRVAERFPTAIVSDIDTWMLTANPALSSLPISGFVTSEQDGAYKAMADCTMFSRAADILGCAPENIVHVGDSSADVVGAKRVGARSIWLNRDGNGRPEGMPVPDAEIHTLKGLPAILTSLISQDGTSVGHVPMRTPRVSVRDR